MFLQIVGLREWFVHGKGIVKSRLMLLVKVAFFILAFVALYLHADYHFLSTYGKTDKVSETVPILD